MNQQPTVSIPPEYFEQNPLVAVAFMVFLLMFVAFVIGSLSSWVFLVYRTVKGKPLLAPELWKLRVWGFVDLLIAVVIVIFWQRQSALIGYSLLGLNREEIIAEKSIPLPLATIIGLGSVLALLSICIWMALRHRASMTQLGFGFTRFWKHVAIGVIAALASIPLVYALMAAVSIGFNNPYSHPLLDEMKRQGSLSGYLLAVTSAVLIAPLVEEFFFRVLIQGWLQSAPFGSIESIFLGQREQTNVEYIVTSPQPAPAQAAIQPQVINPYAPSEVRISSPVIRSTATDESADDESTISKPTFTPPLWPSFVTGTLFGLAHYGYGLSFIPLIVLGIILGLLYRATHSIWPSLVVHFILNGSSMTALGISILIEQASQS